MTPAAEFPFVLPQGYVDADGQVHREGVMRLATAYDEVTPMKDPRVQANPAYLTIILLARVITRLGTVAQMTPKVIEGLYARDLAYLQALYQRLNQTGTPRVSVTCPHCEKAFEVDVDQPGGI